MNIIQCENCGKRYKVPVNNNGKTGTAKYKCKACHQNIIISDVERLRDPFLPAIIEPISAQNGASDNNDVSKRSFTLRSKFNLTIGAAMVCALIMIYIWSASWQKRDAEAQVVDKAQLLLAAMQASRGFTSELFKPSIYEDAVAQRIFAEGMGSAFSARHIINQVHQIDPQYHFKHAALSPRNPANQADPFESILIRDFNRDRDLKQWNGYRTVGNELHYSVIKPIIADRSCIRCHSQPASAPQRLLEIYGEHKGFGLSLGDIIGILTVSVPSSLLEAGAKTDALAFLGIVSIFFAALILIANIFFAKAVLKPITNLADNADEISLGKLDTQINISGGDEIAILAKAFDRMKISIKMAVEQLAR